MRRTHKGTQFVPFSWPIVIQIQLPPCQSKSRYTKFRARKLVTYTFVNWGLELSDSSKAIILAFPYCIHDSHCSRTRLTKSKMASNKLEIIYGGFFAKYRGHTVETVKRVLQHLEHKRIAKIDTAAVYAESEEFLGLAGAANHFKIDTKFCGGLSELEPTRELVVKSCHKSLSKLQTNCVR